MVCCTNCRKKCHFAVRESPSAVGQIWPREGCRPASQLTRANQPRKYSVPRNLPTQYARRDAAGFCTKRASKSAKSGVRRRCAVGPPLRSRQIVGVRRLASTRALKPFLCASPLLSPGPPFGQPLEIPPDSVVADTSVQPGRFAISLQHSCKYCTVTWDETSGPVRRILPQPSADDQRRSSVAGHDGSAGWIGRGPSPTT